MKPGTGMDEKSTNFAVVMQQPQNTQEPETYRKSNTRLKIGIVSGIILVLIIVTAVLLAVFLGAKVTKDAQKEAWLNYKGKDGEKKSEHVVVDDREEDYTVPNEFRVIYDFEKGYAVYKLERSDDDESDRDYSVCYVSHLDRENVSSPQEVKDAMTDSEIDVPKPNTEAKEFKYVSTGQAFDRDLLSYRAQEMCKDSKVVWMARKTGEMKDKRDICLWYRCYYVYLDGTLYYYCYYFYDYC